MAIFEQNEKEVRYKIILSNQANTNGVAVIYPATGVDAKKLMESLVEKGLNVELKPVDQEITDLKL